MPTYNVETFIHDSMNSILNQTLSDIELICVDDGSDDDTLKILEEYEDKDNRVKLFSLNHQGAGNARNYALNYVSGEYIYYMDSDDILYLNAFEDFYLLSKAKKLDLLIFKAMNYDVSKNSYYETEYYNMTQLSKFANRNIFSFNDLGDLIFNICETPWCKFYNAEMVKKSGAKFRENSKFNDNQFHWEILFNSKRIYFLDEYYYIRTRHSESLTASKDENHMDIIGVSNDIIDLFGKYDYLDIYKKMLYNLKVKWILFRYDEIKNEYKEKFYNKIKMDFKYKCPPDFKEMLWNKQKFYYGCFTISKKHKDYTQLSEYYLIINNNQLNQNDKIKLINKWFYSISNSYKNYFINTIKNDLKKYDEDKLNLDNKNFYENIMKYEICEN